MTDLDSREAYLLDRRSSVNNVYKELLVFRSLYDPDNSKKDGSGEIIEKLYWVKAIKDYPYIEIVHGKPYLLDNSINNPVLEQTGKNFAITPSMSSAIKFGETIKMPSIIISDTGHVIDAKAREFTMPTINTQYPLKIENELAGNGVLLTHRPLTATPSDGYANPVTLIAPSSPNFGENLTVNAPKYDKYGHYKVNDPQTVKMPNIAVTEPITKTEIFPTAGRGAGVQIGHKNDYDVISPSIEAIGDSGRITDATQIMLNESYALQTGKNDNTGHINESVEVPFQVVHPDYCLDGASYVTPLLENDDNPTTPLSPNTPVGNRIGVAILPTQMESTLDESGNLSVSYYLTASQNQQIASCKINFTIYSSEGVSIPTLAWIINEDWIQAEEIGTFGNTFIVRPGSIIAGTSNPLLTIKSNGAVTGLTQGKAIVIACNCTNTNYQCHDATVVAGGTSVKDYEVLYSGKILKIPTFWVSKEGHVTGYDYKNFQIDPFLGSQSKGFYQTLQEITSQQTGDPSRSQQESIKSDMSSLVGIPPSELANGFDIYSGLPIYAGPGRTAKEGEPTIYGLLGVPICKAVIPPGGSRATYATIVMVYEALRELQENLRTTNMTVNGLLRASTGSNDASSYLDTSRVLEGDKPNASLLEPFAIKNSANSKEFTAGEVTTSGYVDSNNRKVSLQEAFDELKNKYDTLINMLPELITTLTTYTSGTSNAFNDINSSDLRVKEEATEVVNKVNATLARATVNLTKSENP